MQLTSSEHEGVFYSLQLTDHQEGRLAMFNVEFRNEWYFTSKSMDFKEAISVVAIGDEQSFPYELKNDFRTIPMHMPHPICRELFKQCIDYFVSETNAPIHISFTHHPGYPITLLTYNPLIIEKEKVADVIASINHGIKHAVVEFEELEKEEPQVEEEEDVVDENVILDYEEDDELKRLMKQPAQTEYLPMEGE